MGTWTELQATDGHRLEAYRTMPASRPRGRLLVLQEIFGINGHMRAVADGFAEAGYECLVPALFDRAERGVELGYDARDVERGRALRAAIPLDKVVVDMGVAVADLRSRGKVGALGYCWGGSLAWAAAQRLPVAAAVGYYGGQIVQMLDQAPKAPVMLHFGERDHGIPLDDVAKIRAAFPDVPVHLYPAGHGFNCDQRADFDAACAALARERTLAFLALHLD
ncbi:MAG: dienelactone hydrolase family protein [Alphaproteobacteria bacterium]